MLFRKVVCMTVLTFAGLPLFGQIARQSPVAATAPTVVPALVPYTATAVDGDGKPLVPGTTGGDVSMTFLLFKDEAGGEPLWTESQRVPIDANGRYSVQLGASSPSGLPLSVFASGEARWLEVQIAGQKQQPRVLLSSVPYAAKAADAATLGGLPASAFALAGSTLAGSALGTNAAIEPLAATPNTTGTVTTTGGISGYLPKFTGTSTVVDSQVFANSSGVGINTTSPAAVLDVNGDMIVRGSTIVARTGNATSAKGYPSNEFAFYANAYNSSTKVANNPHFQLQSEPVGNNTANTSATFNLLYANGGTAEETGFYVNPNGTVHFPPSQTFPGTLYSVGLLASSDFDVFNSPITDGGDIGLFWHITPTSSNVADAIVKRDDSGGFSAGAITGTSLAATGSLTVLNTSFMAAANLAGPIGIGTNSPAALLNLNKNNTANADTLLIGNTSSKGLQLRDNGSGVDIESIGVPLNINYLTEQNVFLNPNGGSLLIDDPQSADSVEGALVVGNFGDRSAYFEGDVLMAGGLFVEGDLNVDGDKDFRIDHPLDPTNKYLVHASIESSEVLNQYSGNVTTDELGLATVHFPDWFGVENTDFRYQLTVIGGQFAQAIVSKEIENNQFTIGTNAAHIKVSWQVTAKRNDPYMKAHPFVVEQEKPASERGHYDHPELYGHPELVRTHGARPSREIPSSPASAAVRP